MPHDLIERAAIAAFEAWGGAEVASGKPWSKQSETFRNAFRGEVRAVIAILESEGYTPPPCPDPTSPPPNATGSTARG